MRGEGDGIAGFILLHLVLGFFIFVVPLYIHGVGSIEAVTSVDGVS